jgi:hypothetical protein
VDGLDLGLSPALRSVRLSSKCLGPDPGGLDLVANEDSTVMAEKWYFARAGKSFGPFSAAQFKELAATEQLRPQDTVWKEGMDKGVPAAKVRQLFSQIHTKAPPSPPGGRTVAAPSPSLSPPRRASSQPPVLAADAVPPARPPVAQARSLEPRVGIPDDLELVPIEDGSLARPVSAAPARTKGRVLGVSGGVLVSQDGVVVKYRNKCHRCGHADMYLTTMPIRIGITSANFFCPKCRKTQQVEVRAVG